MADACNQCGAEIPRHVDRCIGCGCDVGFPNVRMASQAPEIEALDLRHQKAKRNAAQRGAEHRVSELEARLQTSEAVMCKPWGILNTLLLRDSRLLQTFHQEVEAEGRLPESNEFDSARAGVDATFFPYYHAAIRFAALSIDGSGSTAYGGGCLVLKTMSIAARATVFEENTLTFVKRRQHPAGTPPPAGSPQHGHHARSWALQSSLLALTKTRRSPTLHRSYSHKMGGPARMTFSKFTSTVRFTAARWGV